MGNPNIWTVVSAGSMFLPAIVSIWTQSVVVTLVLLTAAGASTLYHSHDESSFSMYDVVGALAAGLLVLLMLLMHMRHYRLWHWRTGVPLLCFLGGLFVYSWRGSAVGQVHPNHIEEYDLYHSIWHVLGTLAALFTVMTPVDLKQLNDLFAATVFLDIWHLNTTGSKRLAVLPFTGVPL
jgi:predicted membrane channel-forming protein YqfA (hemolysin III family)